jgi:hypothetical protein
MKDISVSTAIMFIPIVYAVVQVKRYEIGFPQIDLENWRFELTSVQRDWIAERNKDSGVQPMACRDTDREPEEKKTKPDPEQYFRWHQMSV